MKKHFIICYVGYLKNRGQLFGYTICHSNLKNWEDAITAALEQIKEQKNNKDITIISFSKL